MENLVIYEQVRAVPKEAQREIKGGKLAGKTDINPMWRIKKLTDLFGPCGIGWKTKITNKWIEEGAKGEKSAFVEIELLVKQNGEWSEPIIGIGGSMLVNTEKGQLATNDECFKMAYTDAISVACKALGFGADIYWDSDKTKYSASEEEKKEKVLCNRCGQEVKSVKKKDGTIVTAQDAKEKCGGLCADCYLKEQSEKKFGNNNVNTGIEEIEV